MTEREIKQLYKLLGKFVAAQAIDPQTANDDGDEFNIRESGIISQVRQWVKWFADDRSIDL